MPDEERVRTKRRKLDSIITKLHQTTPLENESLEEGENQNETVEADETTESLSSSSRRKLHRAAKQKSTLQKPTLQKPTSQKPTLEKPTLGKPTFREADLNSF
ncbi:hypothetical protein OS493_008163 [Desmophyllum pertusum]|uniref:Uncharacterized protein n=1 Tax=Desmophyllum pertusum TaxID=174260 RepID=A0A9X0DBQ6_9CNID|nr:hypothetical protein OS493_008163 [Desmophyllum pertusum]